MFVVDIRKKIKVPYCRSMLTKEALSMSPRYFLEHSTGASCVSSSSSSNSLEREARVQQIEVEGPRTRSWRPYFLRSTPLIQPSHLLVSGLLKSSKKRKREAMSNKWSLRDEDTFVQLLAQAVGTGGIVRGRIDSETWKELLVSMRSMSSREWSISQLQSKVNRLQKEHKEFSELLNDTTGLGWDPITNTVDGTAMQWQNLKAAKPHLGVYQKKGCRNYELLGQIFNRSTATGVLGRSSAQPPPDSDEEARLAYRIRTEGVHFNKGEEGSRPMAQSTKDDFVDLDSPQGSGSGGAIGCGGNNKGKQPIHEESRCKGKKKKYADDISMGVSRKSSMRSRSMVDAEHCNMLKEIGDMAKAKRDLAIIQGERVKFSSGGESTGTSAHPMARCMDLLNELAPEFSDEVFLEALKVLMSETVQWSFIKMTPHHRRVWLSKLLP